MSDRDLLRRIERLERDNMELRQRLNKLPVRFGAGGGGDAVGPEPSDATPEPVAASGDPGTSDLYSRADHIHEGADGAGLSNQAPLQGHSSNQAGSGEAASRWDHRHKTFATSLDSSPNGFVAVSGGIGYIRVSNTWIRVTHFD